MRFNKQELVALASQTSQNFDREGVLVLKERQDGFFRRSEGCSARWFRLRGNLLFYLRGTEQLSEPMGVIVLGHHSINVLPQDENGHWPFHIVWDNGACYKMATFLESERTLWLKAIESAPYDQLKSRMSALKEKLNRMRPEIDIVTWRQKQGIVVDIHEIPLCEVAVSCDNLPCDGTGRPPSPAVALFLLVGGASVRYAATETVYSSSNPSFRTTVQIRACDGLAPHSRVRLVVYDRRAPADGCAVALGAHVMTLATMQEAQRLRVSLEQCGQSSNKSAGKSAGFLTVSGWSLEPSAAVASPAHADPHTVELTQKAPSHRRAHSLPPRLGRRLKVPGMASALRAALAAGWQATFRFHSGLGADVAVHDAMYEPRMCYTMPAQLLSIYIASERRSLRALLSLGEAPGAGAGAPGAPGGGGRGCGSCCTRTWR